MADLSSNPMDTAMIAEFKRLAKEHGGYIGDQFHCAALRMTGLKDDVERLTGERDDAQDDCRAMQERLQRAIDGGTKLRAALKHLSEYWTSGGHGRVRCFDCDEAKRLLSAEPSSDETAGDSDFCDCGDYPNGPLRRKADCPRHSAEKAPETTATHDCRAMDLANELARYFTSGNEIQVERATVSRTSDLFLMLQEVLPDWDYNPVCSAQKAGGEPT